MVTPAVTPVVTPARRRIDRHDWQRGGVYAIVGVALLCTMDMLAKLLVQTGVSGVQIVALRTFVILPLLLGMQLVRGRVGELRTRRPMAHLARGLVGTAAPVLFFTGLAFVSLAHATIIFFSSVFLATILAMLLLGERTGVHRWSAILVGFAGVWLVVGPAGSDGEKLPGYALLAVGALCYSLYFISGRVLAREDSAESLVFSYNLIAGVVTLALLPWLWVAMDAQALLLLLVLSLLALLGHLAMTQAFRHAEASYIAVLDYTALLWAVVFDALVFDGLPTWSTVAGAALIIGRSLYMSTAERRHAAKLIGTT
ncbi:MAG: EamA family transporter [Gammaproteobacteria bacterium]|nr:MAG: EamA family transporter [Gammaproteobacteria bacterium]